MNHYCKLPLVTIKINWCGLVFISNISLQDCYFPVNTIWKFKPPNISLSIHT